MPPCQCKRTFFAPKVRHRRLLARPFGPLAGIKRAHAIHATPQLDHLIAGYRRFRESGWTPRRERWELRATEQPEVMVIACSDSRVDPAQIFDVDPGEIFVVRNVAAMVRRMKPRRAITACRPRWNSRFRC
jgi:hypothetical protein